MTVPATLHRAILLGLTLGAASINGCGGGGGSDSITTPPPPALTVSSVSPTSSFRDVTLDVHVLGSGFAQGARAVWALGADTSFATTGIRTNSTTFVRASELLANITIRADAPAGSFSVNVVAASSKVIIGNVPFSVNLQVELVDLGAGDNSVARGINNGGKIVGYRGTTQQAFLWENGVITNLGVLPGMTFSAAADVNESGQVVGVSGTGTIENTIVARGFIWTAAGGMHALSTLGGAFASARAINDNGDIAGTATASGSPGHAVVWRNGVISDLQPASLALFEGRANAINNMGEVVGYVYRQSGFRSTATVPMTLVPGAGLYYGINNAGCIAAWIGGAIGEGYRTCAGGSLSIGSCGGGGSRSWAINSAGHVVGDAPTAVPVPGSVQWAAFIWTEGGITCFPLPAGANGSSAYGVNDNGWIVGEVGRPVGGNRATLWKVK